MRTPPHRDRAVVTAQDVAISALRQRIATGSLHPGQQLRQELLATELGVSIVPVREALKTLEAEGQVIYAPHRGYFVAQLDLRELTEAYRIRELLEDEAVTRGIPMLVDEDISRMKEAIDDIDRLSGAKEIVAVAAANRRFHFTLFDAAEMPRLTNFIRILWETTEPYRSLYIADPANRRLVNDEHREILEAVCRRDVPQVILLLHKHRDNAIECVRGIFAEEPRN
jgi:DNA-binding GntR family transcriptional regulator